MQQRGVDEDVADPDVGPQAPVLVARLGLEHQPDPAAFDELAVAFAHHRGVELAPARGMIDGGRVHAEITHRLDPSADLGVDEIALDRAGDVGQVALRHGRRGGGDHERDGQEDAARRRRHEGLHDAMIR